MIIFYKSVHVEDPSSSENLLIFNSELITIPISFVDCVLISIKSCLILYGMLEHPNFCHII